jgi:CHAT domain-containing protein/tetratricopeptide (TPR) repeat protein
MKGEDMMKIFLGHSAIWLSRLIACRRMNQVLGIVLATTLLALIAGCANAPAARSGGGENGKSEEGLTYLEGASRFRDIVSQVERKLSAGAEPTASLLGPLCLSYGRLKRFSKLFECLERLDARIRNGDAVIHGDYFIPTSIDAKPLALLLKAEAMVDLGRYREGLTIAKDALPTVPADSLIFSSTWPPARFRLALLSTAAIAAMLANDKAQSESLLKQLETTNVPYSGLAIIKPLKDNALARAYIANARYDDAIRMLNEGRGLASFYRAVGDVANPFAWRGDSLSTIIEIPRQLMLAKALAETGKTNEARDVLDKLLAEPRLADMADLHWLALFERGRIAERDGKPDLAIDFYRKAIELIEQQRSSITTEANRIGFVGDKQALYGRTIALLIDRKRTPEAFDYVERSKARALVDLLASKRDFAVNNADEGAVRTVMTEMLRADEEAGIGADNSSNAGTRGAVLRDLQGLRNQIKSIAPELSSLVTVTSIPLADLQHRLSPREVLLEYYFEDDNLFIFVLDSDNLQAVRSSGAGIGELVQELRRNIQDPGSRRWQFAARNLQKLLIQPVEAMLGDRQLIIVPHGPLHYLPFSILMNQDESILIDDRSVRILPSASVLQFLRPRSGGKDAPVLIFGNPDLGDPKFDLEYAETEARSIGSLFPGSRVLLRREASKTNFKDAASKYSRIHFATHGKFNADSPLDSGLYLAKGSTSDGVLTVSELYSLKFDVDLVSLSACETGLGKISNGDDVIGLTRGFLYAGSRSIVASLWSVDDRATGELMRSFYRNLQQMSISQALRKAQLTTRSHFSHPFFWAAFQVIGRDD